MPIYDQSKHVQNDYSIEELIQSANEMRGLNEIALYAAGSGHSGGTLGVMDISAVLYLKIARHCPSEPSWPDRDRIIWSAGHKAPALYTSLAYAGYFPKEQLARLRMLGSPLQGHPHWRDLPGVEMSAGSLGQGLSVGVGMALAAKLDNKDHRVFVISSDGEHQEGSHWEAVMSAAHHKLSNLIQIIDKNELQIDGPISEVMQIDPLIEKYRSFGWEVISVDGHNIASLVEKLDIARNQTDSDQPIALICHTIKGRGVSFMENALGWHGKAPNETELLALLEELNLDMAPLARSMKEERQSLEAEIDNKLKSETPKFSSNYWWNQSEQMQAKMESTKLGFGRALEKYGDDERIVCIGADISDSISISSFYKNHPERKDRFISIGIAEQNGTTVATGLAREGKIPVFGTYGVFASARNLDQLRVSVCYANLNVLVVGAHGGVSVGPDGATHQELESFFQITGLPNMHFGCPSDSIETEKMTHALLFDIVGPKYLRFAREATPIVSSENSPFEFGVANIYRFRNSSDNFKDAFEIKLSSEYDNENEQLTIISCGPELAEALRAAYILKIEKGIETRVINMHTLKPLDRQAIIRAAGETINIITAEEHQVGGLGNQVAGIIATERRLDKSEIKLDMIGVEDRFGESGKPWQLIRHFGLSAEHIAARAIRLLDL